MSAFPPWFWWAWWTLVSIALAGILHPDWRRVNESLRWVGWLFYQVAMGRLARRRRDAEGEARIIEWLAREGDPGDLRRYLMR